MRRLAVAALLAVVGCLAAAGATSAGADHGHGKRALTFFSTQNAVALLPVVAGQFSVGDRIVFSNNLFTARGGTRVGIDGGECTVVRVTDAAGSGVLQCLVTSSLPGGQITSQALATLTSGAFAGRQTGAITGGTDKYRDAGGEFTVEFLSDGEANLTFFLDD
jgi:hypothetical protein